MSEDIKKQIESIAASVTEIAAAVKDQGSALAKLQSEKVEAANHMAKVEKHAAELEKAADHMDAAGIGGHPTRGHAAILRNMAGDLRANAAQGKIPAVYDAFYCSTAEMNAAADTKTKSAVDQAVAEVKTKHAAEIVEIKASADKAKTDAVKEATDKLAAAETQIADLKAKAVEGVTAPERKTLSPGNMTLLAKAGVEMPTKDGDKLDSANVSKLLAGAGVSVEKRFEIKTGLARLGLMD